MDRRLRVVAHTAGIGGAEISLSHPVTNVSGHIDMTVLGTSQLVVDAIAARRAIAGGVARDRTWDGNGTPSGAVSAAPRRGACQPLHSPGGCDRTRGGADVARCSCRALTNYYAPDALSCGARGRCRYESTRFGRRGFSTIDGRLLRTGSRHGTLDPNCAPDIEGRPQTTDCATFRTVVGSVGRLDRMKGHDILLRGSRRSKARVVILGEGEQRTALTKLRLTSASVTGSTCPGWTIPAPPASSTS